MKDKENAINWKSCISFKAPQILNRRPLDFDFICTRDEYDYWIDKNLSKINPTKMYAISDSKLVVEGSTNCEFELIVPGTSSELLSNLVANDDQSLDTPFGLVPSFDLLFTIKQSHRFLKDSPHFWKTAIDWHRMRLAGAVVRSEYNEFLKLRETETYAKQNHPKLNKSKKDFFDENVNGFLPIYDHDSIHKAVALYDRPAYTYYMKDGSEVLSDKTKFFNSSREIQMAGCYEEITTLFFERAICPHREIWRGKEKQVWLLAASKTASSITSGYFRTFLYDNLFDVIKMYDESVLEKFEKAVQSGIVQPFSKPAY